MLLRSHSWCLKVTAAPKPVSFADERREWSAALSAAVGSASLVTRTTQTPVGGAVVGAWSTDVGSG